MNVLYLLLYLLAGIFFGLAAGRVPGRVDWLALGLLMFAVVSIVQTANRL